MEAVLDWKDRLTRYTSENWPAEAGPEFHDFLTLFMLEAATMGRATEETGNAYRSYYELVLKHGSLKQQAIIVPDNPVLEAMELGQCYYNAFVGSAELGLTYVEGYARTSFLLVPHAWLEDDEGTIIDPTWAHLDDPISNQMTYFGVKMSPEFVLDRADATGHSAVLGSDWMIKHPILKRGLVFEGDFAVALGPERPELEDLDG